MGRSASLGELAVQAGLLTPAHFQHLRGLVARAANTPGAVSLGRLLVQAGLGGAQLQELLASGASLHAVRCDACGAATSQARLTSRDEYPCPQCGALFFGFWAFGPKSAPPGGVAPVSPPRDLERTEEFAGVLPLPGATWSLERDDAAAAQTLADVPALPDGVGVRDYDETSSELALLQADLLASGAATPSVDVRPEPVEELTKSPAAIIGGFEILGVIGSGGVGLILHGRKEGSGQEAAIKVLKQRSARESIPVKRFRWEAEALSRLEHPNVVRVLGAGFDEAAQLHYLALEYLPGGSLDDLLARNPILDERHALEIARGVCRALQAAWEEGIVHRDVKPGNILLGADGEPKLADLGLSKAIEEGVRLTATGAVLGTPLYMAPEQALSERSIDVRADLFSLGCCLHEMLSGRRPFVDAGSSVVKLIRARLTQDLEDIRTRRPDVGEATARVVADLVARRREDRYPTPAPVLRDIERALAGGDALGASDPRCGAEAPPLDPSWTPLPVSGDELETQALLAQTPDPEPKEPPAQTPSPWLWAAAALAAVVVAALLVLVALQAWA